MWIDTPEEEWAIRQFIFINTAKTANASIRRALKIGVDQHMWAALAIDMIGMDKWHEYYTFTFARNPWDRIVSMYSFLAQHEPHELFVQIPRDRIPEGRPKLSFADWVKFIYQDEPELYHMKYHPCTDWFMDGNTQLVDFVGRFETLRADFDHVCKMIGRTSTLNLPHRNKSDRGSYTRYYDDATAEIVANVFARDIEVLEYCYGN